MTETKHERYLRLKKEKQMKALKAANKKLTEDSCSCWSDDSSGISTCAKITCVYSNFKSSTITSATILK